MKKQLLILGMLYSGMAFAQTGNVGINTENPRATLDIALSSNNLVGNSNEGVLVPRVSRARLNSITATNLTESTLVYVNDIAGTTTTTTTDVTAKGFYYYSTTTNKWVRISDTDTIIPQDLRLVGTANHITQDAGVGSNGTSVGTGKNNIAIGMTSLSENTTGENNTAIGTYTMRRNTIGVGNTALGYGALYENTTGRYNTSIGYNSLYSNRIGSHNIALGYQAGFNNTSGDYNIALGAETLKENRTGSRNIALGLGALTSNNGDNNTALGYNVLKSNTTGSGNIGIGIEALEGNIGGVDNTAIGKRTLKSNQSGGHNIAIGSDALGSNTSGNHNIAVGTETLMSNGDGSYNFAFGHKALHRNTSGYQNLGMGTYALENNTTGFYNVGLGYRVLQSNTVGLNNIAMGADALRLNTTGSYNMGAGHFALSENTTGEGNIAIGRQTLMKNTTGGYNISLGYMSLNANTTGGNNIAMGNNALVRNITGEYNNAQGIAALQNNVSGHGNIAIGQTAGEWIKGNSNIHLGNYIIRDLTGELDNVVVIGNGINATNFTPATAQDHTIILGSNLINDSRTPKVGIGTYKPDAKVHIVANTPAAIKIVDTNQGEGKVLTSDANGLATWKDIGLFKAQPLVGKFNWASRTSLGNDGWNKVASVIVKPGTNMVFVKLHILSSQRPSTFVGGGYTRVYVGTKDVGTNNRNTNEVPLYTMFHPYLTQDYEIEGSFIYNNPTNSYQTIYLNLQSDEPNIIRSAYEYNTSPNTVLGTTWYENWFYAVPVN